ncbi:hypothetical protein AAG906_016478 [Vitis piasezkii]
MSRRDRRPPFPMKDIPHVHEPPFSRGLGPRPHPKLLEGMRGAQLQELQFGMGHRLPPPHPWVIEEHLAVQQQEIQGLLVDNQGLAATHVALKQELEAVQQELQRMVHFSGMLQADKDVEMRTMHERLAKIEADLCGMEVMKAEVLKVNADVKELTLARQELTGKVQVMTQDLARAKADLQHASALKEEIESVKHELQQARAAIEYEKKGYAENYQHGQLMENNLISMARELEKLRAELANVDKGASAAASGGNPGYSGNYGNPEAGYAANPYLTNYGMNPVPAGAESFPQYGPGPGSWGAYNMQQAQGHR